jgi:hypothetical protein
MPLTFLRVGFLRTSSAETCGRWSYRGGVLGLRLA